MHVHRQEEGKNRVVRMHLEMYGYGLVMFSSFERST